MMPILKKETKQSHLKLKFEYERQYKNGRIMCTKVGPLLISYDATPSAVEGLEKLKDRIIKKLSPSEYILDRTTKDE